MSILSSLTRAYDRLPDAPPFKFSEEKISFFSEEKISFCISLRADGSVADVIPLGDTGGRNPQPLWMPVPQPVKRAADIAPNIFWDETSYVLGVTAGSDKQRTARKHEAFLKHHLEILDGTNDEGLSALAAFLRGWTPERFTAPVWPEEMRDRNVVFALESERRSNVYLHDRQAARELWNTRRAEQANEHLCKPL